MLFDVHFHPTEPEMASIADVLARAREAGVAGGLATGYDGPSNEQVVEMASRLPGLAAAVGYHPWFLERGTDWERLEQLLAMDWVIAIGETGLDSAVDVDFRKQRQCFEKHLELASKWHLPVVVHSRKTVDAVAEHLRAFPEVSAVLHSYSGSMEQAKPFLQRSNVYFSLSGTVTRDNARRTRTLVRELPLSRLLLETDAPSIALEGVERSQVEPRHIADIARVVARLREVSMEELTDQLEANLAALFSAAPESAMVRRIETPEVAH